MNEIVVASADQLRLLLKDAVAEGVASALKQLTGNEAPTYMNEREAGKYLGVSHMTLRAWRVEKKGPKYHKFDKAVRYSRKELDEWMKSRQMLTIDSLETRHGTAC